MNDIVTEIAGLIQAGYEDATQTELDWQVARSIERRLRGLGWASPEEVRALVAAAGGRLVVPDNLLADPPGAIWTSRRESDFSTVLEVR